jgi:hypothetical protein
MKRQVKFLVLCYFAVGVMAGLIITHLLPTMDYGMAVGGFGLLAFACFFMGVKR